MGDRANCIVKQNDGGEVWFYTHWLGSELPGIVKSALARKLRWNDTAYLGRIIFDAMTEGQHGEETGFGISNSMQDNSYDLIVVDPGRQVVTIESENRSVKSTHTFAEFIAT